MRLIFAVFLPREQFRFENKQQNKKETKQNSNWIQSNYEGVCIREGEGESDFAVLGKLILFATYGIPQIMVGFLLLSAKQQQNNN